MVRQYDGISVTPGSAEDDADCMIMVFDLRNMEVVPLLTYPGFRIGVNLVMATGKDFRYMALEKLGSTRCLH